MKMLEIDSTTEQELVAIFNCALRNEGMRIVHLVNSVNQKIKSQPQCCQEEKVDE